MSIQDAVNYMVEYANGNHGYSQVHRWPEQGIDADCSSLVIQAYENAGFKTRTNGATYTGNMRSVFSQKCGFSVLPVGTPLQAGDVLLNDACHTAMMINSTQLAQASIDEVGGVTGPQQGDQTGVEINIRSYYNYPWNCILRPPGAPVAGTTVTPSTGNSTMVTPFYETSSAGPVWWGEDLTPDDYAGVLGKPITNVKLRVSAGSVKYDVGYGPVTGCNRYDGENGYAGDNKPVNKFWAYLYSPNADQMIQYQLHQTGGGWTNWTNEESWCTVSGSADALRVRIVRC